MRPPICAVCHARFDPFGDQAGDLVRFADYTPLPDGMVGHPKGLEWFGPRHVEAARALQHRSEAEALRQIAR